MGPERYLGLTGRHAWSQAIPFVLCTLLTAGCWSDRGSALTSSTGSATPIVSSAQTPSPQALPHDGLEVTSEQKAGGWTVLADAFGVWVAGAGTLTILDPATGASSLAASGPWDYDFTVLAEYGEGTIFLGSGTTLWELSDGTVLRRFHLPTVGYIDAVRVVPPREALWVAGSALFLGQRARPCRYGLGSGHRSVSGGPGPPPDHRCRRLRLRRLSSVPTPRRSDRPTEWSAACGSAHRTRRDRFHRRGQRPALGRGGRRRPMHRCDLVHSMWGGQDPERDADNGRWQPVMGVVGACKKRGCQR